MSVGRNPYELWTRTEQLLQNEHFIRASTHFDRRTLIKFANELNGPQMKLMHWSTLVDIQRIPHSDEKLAVDALDGIGQYDPSRCEIVMVSHRWLRPRLDSNESHPDSFENEKGKAINEFSKWRRNWVKYHHGFMPEIFYWIDFCCIDQHNLAPNIPFLPLWIACCERFLRIETPDYWERAWCRIEPLLSYLFQFADHQTIIHLDFKFSTTNFNFGKRRDVLILDPTKGQSTDPNDLVRIKLLVDLAHRLQIIQNCQPIEFGKTKVKCFEL